MLGNGPLLPRKRKVPRHPKCPPNTVVIEVSGTPLTPSTRRYLVDLKTYSPGGSGCLGYI